MAHEKQTETTDLTILDYLNEDCWRCVLDYVHIKEVIVSECVSRRWQAVVLRYLRTIRVGLSDYEWWTPFSVIPWPNVRWLELREEDWLLLEFWTKKFGFTVAVAFCRTGSHLRIVRENCPKLESLTIAIQEVSIPLNSKNRSFECLQRLCFENSTAVTDQSLSQFLNSTITELEIHSNGEAEILTGQFLRSIQSKLKLLVLRDVELQLEYLLSAIDWLSELKILALYDVPKRIYENIHLVLEKTTKLEQLYLCFREHGLRVSQHVGRVHSLKGVGGDIVSTDEDLEAVTKGCKELRHLTMGRNTVTARGLEAMVHHAGARLVTLRLGINYNLTDDDMAVCFRGCYNLKVLDVAGCRKLTAQLCPLAGEMRRDIIPRPPPLTIESDSTKWTIQ